jgi:hypothetical protein
MGRTHNIHVEDENISLTKPEEKRLQHREEQNISIDL